MCGTATWAMTGEVIDPRVEPSIFTLLNSHIVKFFSKYLSKYPQTCVVLNPLLKGSFSFGGWKLK